MSSPSGTPSKKADHPGDAVPEAGESLSSDQPIRQRYEDRLDRLALVDLLADEVRRAPTADGFVMALTAPWGEGKTSVLNLVADALEDDVVIVRFNPWLFGDAHALVIRFFGELASQVQADQRLRRVGKRLLSYGQAVAPIGSLFVGPAANVVAQSLGAVAAERTRSIEDERDQLKSDLLKHGQRILVLIDDIDRLHDEEIFDLMRLVKLVGDLPFVTYLLAFDRPYVENALSRDQFNGRSYLEKVVQVAYDLPPIRSSEIQELLWNRLNEVIGPLDHLSVNRDRWAEVFSRAVAPFFANLRDVARYTSGVPNKVALLGKEVALEDILALEALRVFEPRVHQELPNLVEALTQQRSALFFNADTEKEKDKEALEKTIDRANPARKEKVKALLATLFPRAADLLDGPAYQSDHWRARRQVADASAFRAYLHATVDPGTADYMMVEQVLATLGNREQLREILSEADGSVLQDLLQRLPGFKERIDPSAVPVGAAEILRQESRLPEDQGFLPGMASYYLKWALKALFEAIPDPEERMEAFEALYQDAESNSQRFLLLQWFGTSPDQDQERSHERVVDLARTQCLEDDLRKRIRAMGSRELEAEDRLAHLAVHGFGGSSNARSALNAVADGKLILALLKKCRNLDLQENEYVLSLKAAERIFDRASLEHYVDDLADSENLSTEDQEVLELARKALSESIDGSASASDNP